MGQTAQPLTVQARSVQACGGFALR